MKNFVDRIPVKLFYLGIAGVICLFLTGILQVTENTMQNKLYDQQMAKRWSKEGNAAQVTAFFAEDKVENISYFRGIEQSIHQALQLASIVSENENARLWIDAVSRSGKVTLQTERGKVEVNAIGVEGEFFQFHPQRFLSGGAFSEANMMTDGVIIDEVTAWQLFGSSDVAGMQIMIGQVPHLVSGVIEVPEGRMHKAAGLDKSICYLSMESLDRYAIPQGGFTYEAVMPNPIAHFALSTLQAAVGADNEDVIIVENSERYKIIPLIKVIQQFGVRSMSFQGIVFPYWENVARGYEDIFALFLLLKIGLCVLPTVLLIGIICRLWKRKTWNLRTIVRKMQDKAYDISVKRTKKKQEKEITGTKKKAIKNKNTKNVGGVYEKK